LMRARGASVCTSGIERNWSCTQRIWLLTGIGVRSAVALTFAVALRPQWCRAQRQEVSTVSRFATHERAIFANKARATSYLHTLLRTIEPSVLNI
jgi:hypothetical protein